MNLKQTVALVLALAAVLIALACPPYYDDSGLIGGTVYFPFRKPPDDPSITFNGGMLNWEFAFIGFSLLGALVALRKRAGAEQGRLFLWVFAAEMAFLAWRIPDFNSVFEPVFTLFVLNVVAALLLLVICLMIPESRMNDAEVSKPQGTGRA